MGKQAATILTDYLAGDDGDAEPEFAKVSIPMAIVERESL